MRKYFMHWAFEADEAPEILILAIIKKQNLLSPAKYSF